MKRFIFLLFIAVTWSTVVHANVPTSFTYRGVLTDAAGKPETGTFTMTFRLYEGSTSTTAIWTEVQQVAVTAGRFVVVLGSNKAITEEMLAKKDVHLGFQVGTEAEMKPRTALTSVPYAMMCRQLPKGTAIDAASIKVAGKTVVDTTGKWVGSATGLQGPKGDTGATGTPGTPGAKGDSCTVVSVSKDASNNTIMKLQCGSKITTVTIPSGAKGTPGTTGTKGDKGDKGDPGSAAALGDKVTIGKIAGGTAHTSIDTPAISPTTIQVASSPSSP